MTYLTIVSCFPQMKPEASGSQKSEVASPKEEEIELSDDEKAVLNILKTSSPMDLNVLKEKAGLSNKKWDKAIKGLTKNQVARVEKTDAGLFVELM